MKPTPKYKEFSYQFVNSLDHLNWAQLRGLLWYLGYTFINEPPVGTPLSTIQLQAIPLEDKE